MASWRRPWQSWSAGEQVGGLGSDLLLQAGTTLGKLWLTKAVALYEPHTLILHSDAAAVQRCGRTCRRRTGSGRTTCAPQLAGTCSG